MFRKIENKLVAWKESTKKKALADGCVMKFISMKCS